MCNNDIADEHSSSASVPCSNIRQAIDQAKTMRKAMPNSQLATEMAVKYVREIKRP